MDPLSIAPAAQLDHAQLNKLSAHTAPAITPEHIPESDRIKAASTDQASNVLPDPASTDAGVPKKTDVAKHAQLTATLARSGNTKLMAAYLMAHKAAPAA